VNRFQLAKHLIKWGNLEYALNMPYPPPDDLRDRYATIVWARDREAAAREARARCKTYWRDTKLKLKTTRPLPPDDDRDVPEPDEPRRDREPGDDDQ
jgi:hypothetical protein